MGGLFGDSHAQSKSLSSGTSWSNSYGSSRSTSESTSRTEGWSDGVHKRPLLSPDEIGRFLSRIDDKDHPAYPGIVVALLPGQHPVAARRINYFQSPKFEGCFDPHPDHPPPLTLAQLAARDAAMKALPAREPKPEHDEPIGFWKALGLIWQFLTFGRPAVGAGLLACAIGFFVSYSVVRHMNSASATTGAAVVANAPQLNLRSCPASNCSIVTTLNRGDPVTVTKSYDNGWKGITIRYTNGTSARGFVNGDFLSAE